MQSVLANLLLADAPLANLIGNRAQWDTLPQGGAQTESVIMFVISGVTNYTMQGQSGFVSTRVQFDCRGGTAAKARAVAEALNERLSGFRGVFAGTHFQGCFAQAQRTRHDKVDGFEWFTDSRDYTIHWAPA